PTTLARSNRAWTSRDVKTSQPAARRWPSYSDENEYSLLCLRRARLNCRLRLEVPVVPREITLESVLSVAWKRYAVELARIDHELGWHAERTQRLVHLLAADDRNVEVG